MLLSFRDKEGALEIGHYEYVLAGSILADLLHGQTIRVEDMKKEHVLLETDGFVGDAFLDECVEVIRQFK
jgi:hypothetical protein